MRSSGKERVRQIPSWGLVKGGLLNGWHFHFLNFAANQQSLTILARCTPPAWPFPRDIYLSEIHFSQLRAVVGERAKKMAVDPLIASAFRLERLPIPLCLQEQRLTLRALIKRVNAATKPARRDML
jgi:hypothetical protein